MKLNICTAYVQPAMVNLQTEKKGGGGGMFSALISVYVYVWCVCVCVGGWVGVCVCVCVCHFPILPLPQSALSSHQPEGFISCEECKLLIDAVHSEVTKPATQVCSLHVQPSAPFYLFI